MGTIAVDIRKMPSRRQPAAVLRMLAAALLLGCMPCAAWAMPEQGAPLLAHSAALPPLVLVADGDTTSLPDQANRPLEDESAQAPDSSEPTAKIPTTSQPQPQPLPQPQDDSSPAQDAPTTASPTALDAPATAAAPTPVTPASRSNATPAPAPAPAVAGEASPQPGAIPMPTIGWHSYFKALGGLFLILALVFGGLYFLRKVLPRTALGGAKGRQLTLESALSLGPRKSLMVVRFLNKQLVLGVTDTRITCLHIQEDEHEPDDAQSDTPNGDVLKNFADRLKDHL